MRSLSHRQFRTSVLGATDNYALEVSPARPNAPCVIRRVRTRWVSGTAANWQGEVFSTNISGSPTGDLSWEWDGTALGVGTVVDDTVELHTALDSSGNLYFRGNPDVGADNIFDIWLDLEFV